MLHVSNISCILSIVLSMLFGPPTSMSASDYMLFRASIPSSHAHFAWKFTKQASYLVSLSDIPLYVK
jgi:hypothetical protein